MTKVNIINTRTNKHHVPPENNIISFHWYFCQKYKPASNYEKITNEANWGQYTEQTVYLDLSTLSKQRKDEELFPINEN